MIETSITKWIKKKIRRLIGIVEDGDTATHSIASGKYVVWKGNLCKASTAIAIGTTLSTSNLTAVSDGGLNEINGNLASLETVTSESLSGMQSLKKCGKLVIASWTNKTLPSANGWQTLFTLPTGYRPAASLEFTCCADAVKSSDSFQAIEGRAATDGTIKVYMYAPYQGKLCAGQIMFFTN